MTKAVDRHNTSPTKDQEALNGSERRKFPRVLVDWAVDYRAKDNFLYAYISDISAMGIFVRTPNPEPPGTRLNLRFTPPGSSSIELEGQVTSINPPRHDEAPRQPGMGIQFVDITETQREQLLQLVRTFAYLDDDTAAKRRS